MEQNLRDRLSEFIDHALRTGEGFAINKEGKPQYGKTDGYAVAVSDNKLTFGNRIELVKEMILWLDGEGAATFKVERIVGAWMAEDGFLYLDIGYNIPDYEMAVSLGNRFNQKAIWSYAEQKAIPLNGYRTKVSESEGQIEPAEATEMAVNQLIGTLKL